MHEPANAAVEVGGAKLILGDSRELAPSIEADAVITDPVWPNAPEGMFEGVDPLRTFAAVMGNLHSSVRRIVVVMRCDSDPRFLRCIPPATRSFGLQ